MREEVIITVNIDNSHIDDQPHPEHGRKGNSLTKKHGKKREIPLSKIMLEINVGLLER